MWLISYLTSQAGAKVAISEVSQAGHYILVLVQHRVYGRSDDSNLWEVLVELAESLLARNKVDEGYLVFTHSRLFQLLDAKDHTPARGQHRVQDEDSLLLLDVFRELAVEKNGSLVLSSLIPLDKNLTNRDPRK